MSMRFYDPIMIFLQKNMSMDQKEQFFTKSDIILEFKKEHVKKTVKQMLEDLAQ